MVVILVKCPMTFILSHTLIGINSWFNILLKWYKNIIYSSSHYPHISRPLFPADFNSICKTYYGIKGGIVIRNKPFGAQTWMTCESKEQSTAMFATTPCIFGQSISTILTLQDKWGRVSQKEGFQRLVLSQCWEMTQNVNPFQCFLK